MSRDSAGADSGAELVFPQREAQSSPRSERIHYVRQPAPIGHGRAALVIVTCLGSLAFTALAAFNDGQAFIAAASPSLYGSLLLLVFLLAGTGLMIHAGWMGVKVPWHFPAVLVVAAAVLGVLTVPVALRVADKNRAEEPVAVEAAHVDLRNQLLRDKSLAEQNLRLANFSGATLQHVDLTGADLSEADLRNTRFQDVNLSGVDLCGADLRGADLRGARSLDSVIDWSYAFYDRKTQLPRPLSHLLHTEAGPIPDTGRDLLYTCTASITRRIES